MKKPDDIVLMPATPELLHRFFGGPPKLTVVDAVCAVRGDEVIAVGGVHYYCGRMIVFGNLCDELRASKRVLVKAYRLVVEMMRAAKVPVLSICDADIHGADVLLRHMGFRQAQQEVYQWQP